MVHNNPFIIGPFRRLFHVFSSSSEESLLQVREPDAMTPPAAAEPSAMNKMEHFEPDVSATLDQFFSEQQPMPVPPSGPKRRVVEGEFLTDFDYYLFSEGSHYQLYEKLGAHPVILNGVEGVHFAVWAPNATAVSVVSDFNNWQPRVHPLQPQRSTGIWATFIPGSYDGQTYKYYIENMHTGFCEEKSDPYAFYAEVRPCSASRIHDFEQSDYQWSDDQWMRDRGGRHATQAPISIYEVHLGSWARIPEDGHRFLTYREMAPRLAQYVKEHGFTHIELMPITEHPFDGSWGYQVTGFFAPTSRFGSPEDFKYFVDVMHQYDVGVILDWVPSHFPKDAHGLAYFDGTHLFEHADSRVGEHKEWGTLVFNYGRYEVANFLMASAHFWLDYYHLDGLRVDAVASMLYLDYNRNEGEWLPNEFGGRENLEAVHFLKRLNESLYARFPDVMTIAEESTAWTNVSKPTFMGGLGFGYKWDMGWMHDTLQYFERDPVHRKYHMNDLTFRGLYAWTENFALPLSHDEVVHGKHSMLSKMPGDFWQQFANLRTLYGYMFAQPGKKLLFMGNEFGQWNEWNCNESLDWHLTQYREHQGIQRWVTDLNTLYRHVAAMHQLDAQPQGFHMLECNDADNTIMAFMRRGASDNPADVVLFIANFTPVPRDAYRIGVPVDGLWKELLNSDADVYGGSGKGNAGLVMAEATPSHAMPCSLQLDIPPLGCLFLRPQGMCD
jgi:1,4-alpha-glucan branching enzyme